MNVRAIDPTSAALTTQAAAIANSPAKKTPPAATAPAAGACRARDRGGPDHTAAKVAVTEVPASVKREERALYMQILKSVGGNVSAALAALQAKETAEGESCQTSLPGKPGPVAATPDHRRSW